MLTYFARHLQVLFATLGDMRRAPLSSFNTLMIVAITLLLPSLLYICIKTGQSLSDNWQGRPQISIFFQTGLNDQETRLIFEEIQLHPAIALAEYVSARQALEEFKALLGQQSNLEQELAFLGENPLPPSIVVMPNQEYTDSNKLLTLKEELNGIDGIDSIRLDLEWTDRFNAILKTVTQIAALLSALLAVALILIVSNTIKLLIINRRQEIEITKLVGGTDSFVRRPFLYFGALFGFIGATITLILLKLAALFTAESLQELAELYQTTTVIYQLLPTEILGIVLIGTLIGWLAARWSVAQHLRQIKPS